MGSCLSRVISRTSGRRRENEEASSDSSAVAKVISINGDLRQYPTPVLVSHVLASETQLITSSSSSSSSSINYFLCNSDSLYYDEIIPALSTEDQLRPNHIYFLLPASKREQPLSASDMASLAVKASAALHNNTNTKKKKSRVSPLSIMFGVGSRTTTHRSQHEYCYDRDHDDSEEEYAHPESYDYDLTIGLTPSIKKKKSTAGAENKNNIGMRRSGSVRKLQRMASRRAKLAVRSFRLRLTTIYEGTILS